ncbi:MAG: hypothetical protein CTY30_00850 [Methylocystis sp.]|nr:MAG: hypothetical protein CTY30_00850 [Methylocystis sp.]
MGVAMTAVALIQGRLWRAAERRSARSGREYVCATLVDDDSGFWSVVAFHADVMDELTRLDANDRLAAWGALHVELFDKDGAPRICRKIVVDRVLALRPAGALKGAPRRSAAKRATVDRHASDGADVVDGVSA